MNAAMAQNALGLERSGPALASAFGVAKEGTSKEAALGLILKGQEEILSQP